ERDPRHHRVGRRHDEFSRSGKHLPAQVAHARDMPTARLLPLAMVLVAASVVAARAEPPRLILPRLPRPPEIVDFLPMSAGDVPGGMRRIEGFVQRFPDDAQPVTERTVVYVGYDAEQLYVVFVCFDRERDQVGAHLVGRDLLPNDDD